MKEEKLITRLKDYIDSKGISLNSFDSSIGTSNGYIGRMIKNNGAIGSDVLEKIFSVYADLNPIWLLTGKGRKEISTNTNISEPEIQYEKSKSEDVSTLSIIDRNSRCIEKMVETADRNSISLQELVKSNQKLIDIITQKGGSEESGTGD